MPLSLSPSAVCQCFTLVSFCTAIADPNWIKVQNQTDSSKELIYGVSFILHAKQNLTDTAPLGGVNGSAMLLLYALTALCYSVVLFSSSSLLLDVLGVGISCTGLMPSLHFSTALLCLASLSVSGVCLYIIQLNVQEKGLTLLWKQPGNGTSALEASAGDSLYIAVLGLVFSFMAAAFVLFYPIEATTSNLNLSEEPGEDEREPLIVGPKTLAEEPGEGSSID